MAWEGGGRLGGHTHAWIWMRCAATYATPIPAAACVCRRLQARRQSDEPFSALFHPRRARHPLHTAFRSLDAGAYTDIATVPLERVVLDMAVGPGGAGGGGRRGRRGRKGRKGRRGRTG